MKELEGSHRFVRRSTDPDHIFQHGKVQPQAVDLEEAVLGAVLLEKDAFLMVLPILTPEVFYKDQHKTIYNAVVEMAAKGQDVDILTVTNHLKTNGNLEASGGAYYITQLTNRVASSAHVEFHAHIILQKYILREIIRVSSESIRQSFEDTEDVFEVLDGSINAYMKLYNLINARQSSSIADIVLENDRLITMIRNHEKDIVGTKTQFARLDSLTLGLQNGDLIIIAARPGMGKTAFLAALANNIGQAQKIPVGIFSLEMSREQLAFRLESVISRLTYNKIRSGSMTDNEYEAYKYAMDKLMDARIYIDDSAGLNYVQLRAKAYEMKRNHGLGMIMVDYLQLMSAPAMKGRSREQEISEISRSLKKLAKDLNIPVIALSQLSRSVELRGGMKRPELHDLRESGSLEQDADLVMFLYRPEYYKIERDEDGDPFPKGYTELMVKKHRNGSVGRVILKWWGDSMTFTDPDFNYDADRVSTLPSESGDLLFPVNLNDEDDGAPF